jgi:hypothetical protein
VAVWSTLEGMVLLIIGMLLSLGLAVAVVGLVAVPARREGRDVLTQRGEDVVAAIRAQAGVAADASEEAGRRSGTIGTIDNGQEPAPSEPRSSQH